MTEYIPRVAAIEIAKNTVPVKFEQTIGMMPGLRIVFCGNCKHYKKVSASTGQCLFLADLGKVGVAFDDYCSSGEEKDND